MEREKPHFISVIFDKIGNMVEEVKVEMRTLSFWRAVAAECLASFFNLIIICSIYSTMHNDPDLPYSMVQVYSGIVTGLGMIAITTTCLPISGAHINPAISLAAGLTGRISPCRVVVYIVVQTAGGVAGAATVIGLQGEDTPHLPQVKITKLWLEIILTFLLTMLFLRTTLTSKHNSELLIGLTYSACISTAGVSMNPAASLGLACLGSNYHNQWIGWAGPGIGAATAALCYSAITASSYTNHQDYRGKGKQIMTNSLPKYKPTNKMVPTPTQQPTVYISPGNKKRCFSLPYQLPSTQGVGIGNNNKTQHIKKDGKDVKIKKVKKHVHYNKESLDEVFTDGEDQNSGTSSGYYSESFRERSRLFLQDS